MSLLQQAQQAHQSGLTNKAEQIYRQVLDQGIENSIENNENTTARFGLAILLKDSGRHSDALELFKQIISSGNLESKDQLFTCLLSAANTAIPLNQHAQAEQLLRQALAIKPKDDEAMTRLAGVLISLQQEKQALEIIKQMIRNNPKNGAAYNLKGLALCRAGELEKGYKSFQMALKHSPLLLGAIQNLMTYAPKKKKDPFIENLIPQLQANFDHPGTAPAAKMTIAYILSSYYERAAKPELSFHYLKTANDLNRSSYRYQHQDTARLFNSVRDLVSPDTFNNLKDKGVDDDCPIFILGMPRSGTTLIEQIVSSHSQVSAAGEVNYLSEACVESGLILGQAESGQLDSGLLQTVAQHYLEKLKQGKSKPFITDKMPYNFILTGIIALALPKAKIIHCTRDPLETCFSIFKQNFAGTHGYTNNLEELGHYYNAYRSLMAYWQELLGNRMYEANYEAMVNDAEGQIKQLLDFCQLEPEDACFTFHKNKRTVRTASVNQVRKGIYSNALKASKPYEKQLAPLADLLTSYK